MPASGGELGPLPAGRHGYSPEQVAHDQRERILAAVAEVVAAEGYAAITVSDITAVAHVSRRTFYEQFDGKEDCFLAAFDVVVEHLHHLIGEAVKSVEGWPQQVAAALGELLRFFAAEPKLAKLCTVDALTAGPKVAERYREEAIIGFVPMLRPGRKEHEAKTQLPDSTEDTIIGSLASAISREILAGRTESLTDFHRDFVIFALTPYMGAARANEFAAGMSD